MDRHGLDATQGAAYVKWWANGGLITNCRAHFDVVLTVSCSSK